MEKSPNFRRRRKEEGGKKRRREERKEEKEEIREGKEERKEEKEERREGGEKGRRKGGKRRVVTILEACFAFIICMYLVLPCFPSLTFFSRFYLSLVWILVCLCGVSFSRQSCNCFHPPPPGFT